jgi:hypothetical protein
MIYDIIIIGSGMAGLYTAYNIKKISPTTTFLILEKYKKQWIGGRTSNELFYGTEIVTGAGIGRIKKDKLLHSLLDELNLETPDFTTHHHYSNLFTPLDIMKVMKHLRYVHKKYNGPSINFKTFAINVLGEKIYKQFILTVGYTDYENEDVNETLYSYGMEDNICDLKSFRVPWKKMVMKLYKIIGESNFKFSNNVSNITKLGNEPCRFLVETENGIKYTCNKIVISTTITGIRKLLPNPIYKDIEGQPFLLLYGKFSKKSIPIMKEYVKGYTCLPGPLQKIIPINPDTGVYLIAYNDNKNSIALKNNLKNTEENRNLYCELLEKSLGIPDNLLHILAIKDFYWPIGTHYYKPLNQKLYTNRDEFINIAQHPENGILVVGEVVSKHQGWTEGALESVKNVLTKKWINCLC